MLGSLARGKGAFANLLTVFSGLISARAFTFLAAFIIARHSDLGTFGEFTLFFTVFSLLAAMAEKNDNAYVRFASDPEATLDRAGLVGLNLLFKILVLVTLGVTAFLWGDSLADRLFDKPDTGRLLTLGVIAGLGFNIFNTQVAVHQAQRKFRQVSLLRPLPPLIVLLLLIFVIFRQPELYLGNIQLVYLATAFLVAVVVVIRHVSEIRAVINLSRLQIKAYLGLAGTLAISSSVAVIANRMDVFYLTRAASFEEVGLYGGAIRLAMLAAIVTPATQTLLLPRAREALLAGNSYWGYLRLAAFYIGIQGLIVAALMAGSGSLLVLLFGPEYADSRLVAMVLLLQAAVAGLGVPFQLLIQNSRHSVYIIVFALIKLLCVWVFLIVLTPRYGALGVAFATLSATGVYVALSSFFAHFICVPQSRSRE